MSDATMLLTIVSGASMLAHLFFAVAFLYVGATAVRQAIPSAGWLVVVSASINGLSLCLGFVGQLLNTRTADGADAMLQRSAIFGLIGVFATIVSSGALLAAVVQLANRPSDRGIRGD